MVGRWLSFMYSQSDPRQKLLACQTWGKPGIMEIPHLVSKTRHGEQVVGRSRLVRKLHSFSLGASVGAGPASVLGWGTGWRWRCWRWVQVQG